jgi:hypothetical protein
MDETELSNLFNRDTHRQRLINQIKKLEMTIKIFEARLRSVENIALENMIKLKDVETDQKILTRQISYDSFNNIEDFNLDKSFKSLN